MDAMTKSIYTQYQSDTAATLRGLAPTFYFVRAPEDSPYPIVVFHIITVSPEYSNTDIVNTFLVQFSCFTKKIGEGITLVSALNDAYQDQTLTMDNGNFLVCRRETIIGPEYMENIYQTTVDYMTMESRSY